MLLFVLVTAYFRHASERRAMALFLVTYLIVTSFTETGLSDASAYLLELALAASLLTRSETSLMPSPDVQEEPGMKVMVVHNHCRSVGPSGENRVVEQESDALAEGGHEVIRFWRDSDEIDSWPMTRKALIPARLIWSRPASVSSWRRFASTNPTSCMCIAPFR